MLSDNEYVRQLAEIERLAAAGTITADERRGSLQDIGVRRVQASSAQTQRAARRGETIRPDRNY